MRHRRLLSLLALAALLVPGGPGIGAQSTDTLFDDSTVHDVRLLVNSRDLVRLYAGYLTNTYYPADFVWNNIRVKNVAIRSRGVGSRNQSKLGLRVDFNRYTRNQQFLGLRSLVLDNLWQDATFIRENLTMALFRRLGQPSPRQSFCRLFINNGYVGLYAMVEPVDGAFAARAFADPDGYLYEYQWVSPFYGEYLGDDFAPYKLRFHPQTHELDPDATLYGPLRDLFREINEPDDAAWRERVDARIDLAQFVTQAAIEAFLAEEDALLGYQGMNNFYFYRDRSAGRFRVLPWDRDRSFTFLESSVFQNTAENVLMSRALAYPALRALYLDVLDAAAGAATTDDWLVSEIERLASLVAPAALADTRKQFSNEELTQGLEFLRAFAATRPGFVTTEVAAVR